MNNDGTSYKSLFPQKDIDQVNLSKNNFSMLVADLVGVDKNFYLRGWFWVGAEILAPLFQ